LRVADRIHMAGTSPIGPYGDTWAAGDTNEQTKRCFAITEAAVRELGGALAHTVRTRVVYVRHEDWPATARAHAGVFDKIGPG
jgi:enamine deaminase RidA (YjgF/YER057c/UK114 family)